MTATILTAETALHWLALRMTPGLGTRTAVQLIEIFKTPEAVFRASRSELESAGISPGIAQSVSSGCAFDDAVTQQQKLTEAGAVMIPLTDSRYPARLREIFDPPPLLFVRGRTELMNELALGIVGTRRPTAYGTTVAARLAKDLAGAGLTIVSGMARGIDTVAHRAVLEAGLETGGSGNTIAVFGCGVDEVYPAENRRLADQIARDGLVVSEFPMATPPYPQNFPIRNRIIAGMSVGVLVVEGGEYSGSAITAKLAIEQNREVFAVPGNITSKMSWGPNLLIKQGAKLVQEWNDVVVELKAEDRRSLAERCRKQLNLKDAESKSELQASLQLGTATFGPNEIGRTLLNHLRPDAPVTLDHLVESLVEASPGEVIAALFELELAGLIRQLPGKSFIKVWLD